MRAQIQEKDFENIYRQTYNELLRYIVIKCNNIDDINDILQETYVELLKKMRKKKVLELDNMESFLFGISNNVIKRHFYKKKKENKIFFNTTDEKISDIDIKDDFDLEQEFITKNNVDKAWKYINSKDLITTKVFYLYFVLELKIGEISQELNITESNVKNKIYRTLKEIKEYIGKEV